MVKARFDQECIVEDLGRLVHPDQVRFLVLGRRELGLDFKGGRRWRLLIVTVLRGGRHLNQTIESILSIS